MVGTTLLFGSVGTAFLVGGAFGARHAIEADHVAVVATLVEDERRSVPTGVAWGVGHSVPILLLGSSFLALDLHVPTWIASTFDLLAAVLLVGLGLRVLVGSEAVGVSILRHIHGERSAQANGGHVHVSLRGHEIGFTHTHTEDESLAVGVIHGLAGSGGVVVAMAAAAPTVGRGAAFLVGFSLTSVAAMGIAAWAWGRVVDHAATLRFAAGVASIAVGLLLLAETVGVSGLV